MLTDLERVQTEPHLLLSECAVLFNHHEYFAEMCLKHQAPQVIPYIRGKILEALLMFRKNRNGLNRWS